MNYAPFGVPLQSFVCFLVPSFDLKKSLKPLQHNERQKKKSKFYFQDKVGPRKSRKMAEVRFQAKIRVQKSHIAVWASVAQKQGGIPPIHGKYVKISSISNPLIYIFY